MAASLKSITTKLALPNGMHMPAIGLGTWKTASSDAKAAVLAAVHMGYRHIDTAAVYENEQQIGEALQELFASGVVKREELWITSKVFNSKPFHETLQKSLKDLQLSYLDLYLGLAKCIGVSNFSKIKLQSILSQCRIKPHVHQFESHPAFRNDSLIQYSQKEGIHVTAYSPLGSPDSADMMQRGSDDPAPLRLPVVHEAAKHTGKTPAQVLVRYALQRGLSVIPKSASPEHIKENLDVFDWSLSKDDFDKLNSVEPQVRKCHLGMVLNEAGPYKTFEQLWEE